MPDFDPLQIERADVYKGDILAAHLERTESGIRFSYDPDYPSELPDVATTLPRRAGDRTTQGTAVPPFFAGLLPEGRRLRGIVQASKTSVDDEFSILLAVGQDMIGDVRVIPEGTIPKEPKPIPIRDGLLFSSLLEESYGPNALADSSSVPGVQNKLSNSMISFPVPLGRHPSILKLNPPSFEKLVENEAFFLGVAANVGLKTPEWQLVNDSSGEPGLLVRRFDRGGRGSSRRRIAQEDALQLSNRWPGDKYRLSSREVFAAMTARAGSGVLTARELLKQFLFSYLIGNGDLHGKNLSLHSPNEGTFELTPAYDLISTAAYGDDNMALEFEGRKSNLSAGDFVHMGERFGLRTALGERLIGDLIDSFEPAIDRYGDMGLSDRATTAMVKASRQRIARLRPGRAPRS